MGLTHNVLMNLSRNSLDKYFLVSKHWTSFVISEINDHCMYHSAIWVSVMWGVTCSNCVDCRIVKNCWATNRRVTTVANTLIVCSDSKHLRQPTVAWSRWICRTPYVQLICILTIKIKTNVLAINIVQQLLSVQ